MKDFADLKNFPYYILSCLFANMISLVITDVKTNLIGIIAITIYIFLIELLKDKGKFMTWVFTVNAQAMFFIPTDLPLLWIFSHAINMFIVIPLISTF